MTLHDLETALGENNGNFGAGYIESRGERFTVRGLGRLANEADIGNVVVSTRAAARRFTSTMSRSVTVGPMPREGAVSRDGRGETLSGMIVMLKGANGKRGRHGRRGAAGRGPPAAAARRDDSPVLQPG